MEITSVNNEKVKFWQKLNQKKYRDNAKLFLVEDEHLVNEALNQNIVKEIITIDKNNSFNVPTYYVTEKIMKTISTQVTGAKIIAVCYFLEEKEFGNKIIILDEVQDPGNLGTIIRSSVAFDFDTIVLSENTVDLYNNKTIRASEGMLFHINIIKRNLKGLIHELKKENYQVLGTNVENGENIKKICLNSKLAIILGNEGNGVKKEIQELCDKNVYIKTNDKCESLNVGIAASILMYEINNKE